MISYDRVFGDLVFGEWDLKKMGVGIFFFVIYNVGGMIFNLCLIWENGYILY